MVLDVTKRMLKRFGVKSFQVTNTPLHHAVAKMIQESNDAYDLLNVGTGRMDAAMSHMMNAEREAGHTQTGFELHNIDQVIVVTQKQIKQAMDNLKMIQHRLRAVPT